MLSEQSQELLASRDQYRLLKSTFTDYVRQCEDIFGEQEARTAHLQAANDQMQAQLTKMGQEVEYYKKKMAGVPITPP